MSLTPSKYIIQYSANRNFCIGVQGEPGENSLVVLVPSSSPNTEWLRDTTTGLISLASNPSLVLSVQGVQQADLVPLCLFPRQDGANNQRWNWVGDSGLILLASNPLFCIDNRGGAQQPGNPIQIYTIESNDPNQQWLFQQGT